MTAVVQRVLEARVTVDARPIGEIGQGILALVAVRREDTDKDVAWMAPKLVGLRIFRDETAQQKFDRSVLDIGGGVLLVSNFTLAADTRKGRRPSLDGAAAPERARVMFDALVDAVRAQGASVATGEFGGSMLVSLVNDGPVTFIVDSRGGDEPLRA